MGHVNDTTFYNARSQTKCSYQYILDMKPLLRVRLREGSNCCQGQRGTSQRPAVSRRCGNCCHKTQSPGSSSLVEGSSTWHVKVECLVSSVAESCFMNCDCNWCMTESETKRLWSKRSEVRWSLWVLLQSHLYAGKGEMILLRNLELDFIIILYDYESCLHDEQTAAEWSVVKLAFLSAFLECQENVHCSFDCAGHEAGTREELNQIVRVDCGLNFLFKSNKKLGCLKV